MASTWRAGRNENAAASTSRTGSSCRRRSRTSTGRPSFARSSTDLPLLTVVGASSTSWSSQLRRSNRARRFGSAATPKTTNIRGRRCRRHWQQRRAPPAFDASGRGIPTLSRQHGRDPISGARFRSDHASTEYGINPGSGVAGVSFLNITASGFARADQSRERYHSVGADPAAIPSRHCRK